MNGEAPKRILVVDDNKDFADIFCEVLRSHDYDAESCYGGAQAVERVRSGQFGVIFMDVLMPDMNGVAALKEIMKIRPETTVIMMTGYSVDELVHKAFEEKASDIIYKPFEISKVLSLLQTTTVSGQGPCV